MTPSEAITVSVISSLIVAVIIGGFMAYISMRELRIMTSFLREEINAIKKQLQELFVPR